MIFKMEKTINEYKKLQFHMNSDSEFQNTTLDIVYMHQYTGAAERNFKLYYLILYKTQIGSRLPIG